MKFTNEIDINDFNSKVNAYVDIADDLNIITNNQLKLINDLFANSNIIEHTYQLDDLDEDDQSATDNAVKIVMNALPDVSTYQPDDQLYIIVRIVEFGLFSYASSSIEHLPEVKSYLVFVNDVRRSICKQLNFDLSKYTSEAQRYLPVLGNQADMLDKLIVNKKIIVKSIMDNNKSKIEKISFAVVNQFVPKYDDISDLNDRINQLVQTLEIALAIFKVQELTELDDDIINNFTSEVCAKALERIE